MCDIQEMSQTCPVFHQCFTCSDNNYKLRYTLAPANVSNITSCVCVITGFPVPNERPRFTLSPVAHDQRDLSYSQLSHHAFQQYQLGGIPEGHSLKSDSGLVTGGTLWDMDGMAQPVRSCTGSPGNQPVNSHTGLLCLRLNKTIK